jgi:hypothetical protein
LVFFQYQSPLLRTQQFFRDLNAMTAQAVLEFRLSCPDCGGQEMPLERALELLNQAQSLDEVG